MGLEGLKCLNTVGSADLQKLLVEAEEFHGHLGPFLVIGVRAGLIGLRELGVRRGVRCLTSTVMLEYRPPYSCVLDGIQVSTGCTFGNKQLKMRDATSIVIAFENDGSKKITLEVNPQVLSKLRRMLPERRDQEGLHRIASLVASMDESDLFLINDGVEESGPVS